MARKLFLILKEKSLFFVFKNKHNFWLKFFLFLIIAGLFSPTSSAQAVAPAVIVVAALLAAGGVGYVVGGERFILASIANFINALLILILQLPLLAVNAYQWISVSVLKLVTSPNFISLSYTRPEGNPLLEAGWTLTRDLANMAFVIIFVIIGLATALRIKEYQWQKTLPNLLLIALLINFTPVILGLIVDAANIIMNFFLEEGISFDLWSHSFDSWIVNIIAQFKGIPDSAWKPFALGQTITLIFFGFISGTVLLLYSLLFIMRYIAIWMLVILSPIAFAAYILPGTRNIWRQWWSQFIQWSFIGAIAGFFLYLSSHLAFLARPGGNLLLRFDETGEVGQATGALNEFLPFGIVIAFLIVGFFTGFSGAAMGASAVIGFAQKGAKAAPALPALLGKKSMDVARGIPAVSRAEERIRRGLETIPGISRIPGLRPGSLEIEKQAKIKAATDSLEKIPDNPEGKNALLRIARRLPLTKEARHEKAAAIELLAKRKKLEFANDAEAKKLLSQAQEYGADTSVIYKARPDFAQHLTKPDGTPMTIKDAMDGITPGDFWRDVQKDAFRNSEVALQTVLDREKMRLGRRRNRDIKKALKDSFNTMIIPTLTTRELDILTESARDIVHDPNWQI